MKPEDLRKAAEAMAISIGIAIYIRDGRLWQKGPGERVEPPAPSREALASHGRFEAEAVSKP